MQTSVFVSFGGTRWNVEVIVEAEADEDDVEVYGFVEKFKRVNWKVKILKLSHWGKNK